ncbi:MAG: PASTA domain-containing protein [Gloeobacteraceae cyanobacterium ES-bin-316]|nr:PASTA domain-containing protein [Ferruginibacter sp.]
MFKSLTHRPFWVNLLVAISLALLILFLVLKMLGSITKHGDYLTVPSVLGKKTAEAIKFLEAKGFEVQIQDSVYIDTSKMGIVLKQLPDPNSTVKINRIIFLTVNRVTLPLVDMPSLQGKTMSYALEILKRSHLELGDTTFKPDFMRGSVLEQTYKGNAITSGTKLPWGSRVDLVIGSGLADQKIMVPDLIGMTLAEAKLVLEQAGLGLAAVITDPGTKDTLGAFVFKQNPPRFTEENQAVYIQSGQLMDVWVSPVLKVLKDSTQKTEQE